MLGTRDVRRRLSCAVQHGGLHPLRTGPRIRSGACVRRPTGRCGWEAATPPASARSIRSPSGIYNDGKHGREDHARGPQRQGRGRPPLLFHGHQPDPRLHQDLGQRLPKPVPLQAATGGGLDVGDVGWATWRGGRPRPHRPGYRWQVLRVALLRGRRRSTSGYQDLSGCAGPVRQRAREHPHSGPSTSTRTPARTARRSSAAHLHRRSLPGGLPNDIFFGDYAQGFVRRLNNRRPGQVTGVAASPPAGVASIWSSRRAANWPTRTSGAARSEGRLHGDPGNHAPTARFTATPLAGPAPLTVTFNGSGSSDPDRDPLSYRWDFDDGGTSNAVSPTHTFNAPGNYTVRLTVSDAWRRDRRRREGRRGGPADAPECRVPRRIRVARSS